jgi:hypothetical protein
VTAPTLTDEQIDDLRRDVEAGKRRRVVLLTDSAGLPAGGTGDVVRVGQPDADGGDFIGVRIGGDDLFFSPAELGLGGRRSGAKAGSAKAAAPARTTPSAEATPAARTPAKVRPAKPTADDAAPAASAYAKASPTKAGPAKTTPAKTSAANTSPTKTSPTKTSPAETGPAETTPAKAAKVPAKAVRGGRKPPRLPSIAITIRSTDAGWTVEALRGGKAALKATPVRAGTVQEIADALDEAVVTAAVREVLDARRAVAESEAEELREALARAEAVLAEYDAGH